MNQSEVKRVGRSRVLSAVLALSMVFALFGTSTMAYAAAEPDEDDPIIISAQLGDYNAVDINNDYLWIYFMVPYGITDTELNALAFSAVSSEGTQCVLSAWQDGVATCSLQDTTNNNVEIYEYDVHLLFSYPDTLITTLLGTWTGTGTATTVVALPYGNGNSFAGVVVDGDMLVEDQDYTVSGDTTTTTVVLTEEYLTTLSNGDYRVQVVFDTGALSQTLTIAVPTYEVIYNFGDWKGSGSAVARLDAPFDEFLFLTLEDDELIEGDDYTVASGSTIITLSESFLKSLPAGDYTFEAYFLNGEIIEISLRIVDGLPQTGDASLAVGAGMLFLALAGVGALGLGFVQRRKSVLSAQ